MDGSGAGVPLLLGTTADGENLSEKRPTGGVRDFLHEKDSAVEDEKLALQTVLSELQLSPVIRPGESTGTRGAGALSSDTLLHTFGGEDFSFFLGDDDQEQRTRSSLLGGGKNIVEGAG
ncbi:unnamed protein product, partial [Amoebophrya sp. A25]|eukprot:GSA25T00023905001.1